MTLSKAIEDLKSELVLMARKAESTFEESVSCLDSRNETQVDMVRKLDAEIDRMEIELDNHCMRLLALRDPYGVDFRFVISVVKMIPELERIGDQSKTIAKWSLQLPGPLSEDIKQLIIKTREALGLSIRSIIEGDTKLADSVMQLEFQVDAIEDRIINSAPSLAEAFIAKALERIGDLATNLAENVYYFVKAEDIRHGQYQGGDSAG